MGYLQEARENHVKKKVEEALRSKMKQKALKECDVLCSKYAECARGRTFSVVWTCRKQAKELNNCLHQLNLCRFLGAAPEQSVKLLHKITEYDVLVTKCTNDAILEDMKKAYMAEEERKEKNK